jgi:hypothetical protein
VCLVVGSLPVVLLGTTLWTLHEASAIGGPKSVQQQCIDIWDTVCLKAVWKPMAFVYLFNLLQVSYDSFVLYMSSSMMCVLAECVYDCCTNL